MYRKARLIWGVFFVVCNCSLGTLARLARGRIDSRQRSCLCVACPLGQACGRRWMSSNNSAPEMGGISRVRSIGVVVDTGGQRGSEQSKTMPWPQPIEPPSRRMGSCMADPESSCALWRMRRLREAGGRRAGGASPSCSIVCYRRGRDSQRPCRGMRSILNRLLFVAPITPDPQTLTATLGVEMPLAPEQWGTRVARDCHPADLALSVRRCSEGKDPKRDRGRFAADPTGSAETRDSPKRVHDMDSLGSLPDRQVDAWKSECRCVVYRKHGVNFRVRGSAT